MSMPPVSLVTKPRAFWLTLVYALFVWLILELIGLVLLCPASTRHQAELALGLIPWALLAGRFLVRHHARIRCGLSHYSAPIFLLGQGALNVQNALRHHSGIAGAFAIALIIGGVLSLATIVAATVDRRRAKPGDASSGVPPSPSP
jgi:hypothetical protein